MNQKNLSLISLFKKPQQFVDKLGMYRVVTLSLLVLVVWSLVAGSIGWLAYGPLPQLVSLVIALVIGFGVNSLCAKIWKITTNHESALITILILFFLVIPSASFVDNIQLMTATVLAMVSKYVITYRKQHIINPVVAGTVLLVIFIGIYNLVTGSNVNVDIFTWWVASPIFILPVLITGILIVCKIRKWTPVLWFIGVGLSVFLLESIRFEEPLLESAAVYFESYPTLFLAFFMLTEPFTMPPTKKTQAIYGGLVGAISSTALFASFFAITPELALLIGNLFAYFFRIRQKLQLELISKKEIARNVWEFTFKKPSSFNFKAGQYLEWMLPHSKPDNRGLRRYFTIASSPTEPAIRLAFTVELSNGSSYKKAILNLKSGEKITASQLAGDFLLPKNIKKSKNIKLGFIAGGIGVTPFSSHLHYMADNNIAADTTLYYCCKKVDEIAYKNKLTSLDIPLQFIPVVSGDCSDDGCETGRINLEMLKRRTPDFKERLWYLSGPPNMVDAYTLLLRKAGVFRSNIKQDFFPGLA